MEPPQYVRLNPTYNKRTKKFDWPNPGVQLYEHWEKVLNDFAGSSRWTTNNGSVSMMYGASPGFGIGFLRESTSNGTALPAGAKVPNQSTRLNIAFGFVGYHGKDISQHGATLQFVIRADGSFLLGNMHGEHLRTIISRNTFLGWSYFHGQYHWRPYFTGTTDVGQYHSGPQGLTLLRQPYVPEKVIRSYPWSPYGWWSKLVDVNKTGEFTLAHAQNYDASHNTGSVGVDGAKTYDKFALTRERRIKVAENRDLISRGLLTPSQRRVRMSEEQREQRIEVDSVRMAALMVSS